MPLTIGQQVWYAFNYAGGDTAVLVRMGVSPSKSATFSVWTPENLRRWVAGETPTPVGKGVPSDLFGGDLVWTGSFTFPGTYYVLVAQTGSTPGTYMLTINGTGVSFPPAKAETAVAPAAAAAKTAATAKAAPDEKEAAASAAKAAPAPAAKAGSGPGDALTPSGEWKPLALGQKVWYALPQDGGGSQVLARMAVDPANSATFKILTPDQVRMWADGVAYEPVGRGASNSDLGNDLVWTGSFKTPGTYYIVVEQNGPNAGGYKLSVN